MKRTTVILTALLGLFAFATPASADLVITVLDTTMAENATSQFVDVRISSTTGTDLLAIYNYQFQLTPQGGNPDLGALDFDATNNVYNNAYKNGPPAYVFAAHTGYSNGDQIGNSSAPFDQFNAGDFSTDSGNFVNVTVGDSGNPSLLARLLLVPEFGTNAPHVGDKFDISLVTDPNVTNFQYADADNNLHDVAFTGVTGTVTIGPPVTPVPEPGTTALLSGAASAVLVGSALRRRRSR